MKTLIETAQLVESFLRNRWHSALALLVAVGFSFWLSFSAIELLLADNPFGYSVKLLWGIKVAGGLILTILFFGGWLSYRRFPRRSKNKIGILLAIRNNTDEARAVRKEVIEKFEELIKQTSSSDLIEILPLRDFQAAKITDDTKATKASNITKCHFVIYGKVLNFSGDYEFNLNFVVRHTPLDISKQSFVRGGFTEALANKNWRFIQTDTFNGIKVTAKNIREIALYVIGIAAHQSMDFIVARQLHEDLRSIFAADPSRKAGLGLVPQRLPVWISSSYTFLALKNYLENDLPGALALNATAMQLNSDNVNALLNQAFLVFENGDPREAKRIIKSIRKRNARGTINDGSWLYSEAFLYFNEGQYASGLGSYKKAFKVVVPEPVIANVINFIKNYIEKHPEKIQFHVALALIFIKQFQLYTLAIDQLEVFFSQYNNDPAYALLIPVSKDLLRETYDTLGMTSTERIQI
jgi:tetratricopeptide (TPR) repeat protein